MHPVSMAFNDYSVPYATGSLSFLSPNMQLSPPGHMRGQPAWYFPPPPPALLSLPRQHSDHPLSPSGPIYNRPPHCTLSCYAPPVASALPSVPMYNVSPAYSPAGAIAPANAPRPVHLDLPPPPLAYTPALWAGSANKTVCYSPEVPSSAASARLEYFYEPEDSSSGGSQCSSLSESPSPPSNVVVQEEELHNPALSTPEAVCSSPIPESERIFKAQSHPRRHKSERNAQRSLLIVTDDQQFICDVCGAVFVRKHDGERHRRSHTGERPFPCLGGCGKTFRRADARSRHWGVYRECEWQHSLFVAGTPEGARRERRLLRRARRAELVKQGLARPQIERILKKM